MFGLFSDGEEVNLGGGQEGYLNKISISLPLSHGRGDGRVRHSAAAGHEATSGFFPTIKEAEVFRGMKWHWFTADCPSFFHGLLIPKDPAVAWRMADVTSWPPQPQPSITTRTRSLSWRHCVKGGFPGI